MIKREKNDLNEGIRPPRMPTVEELIEGHTVAIEGKEEAEEVGSSNQTKPPYDKIKPSIKTHVPPRKK